MDIDVVSRQSLEQFLLYITNDIESGQSSLGRELEFFERNDFDPSIANRLYSDFGEWVNGFESPLGIKLPDGSYAGSGRDIDFVRRVAIQLRNLFRENFGKPHLSDNEIDSFTMKFSPLPHWGKRPGLWNAAQGDVYNASEEELQLALVFAKKHYPEIIKYARELKNIAPQQGYSLQDVWGRGVTLSYAADALYATLPSLDGYKSVSGTHELENMFRI